jgi:hypothetical protein
MNRVIGLPNEYYDRAQSPVRLNKTGADTVLGGAYSVDLPGDDADSKTSSATDPDKSQGNVTAVSTADIACGQILVSKGIYADDDGGEFVEGEGVVVNALVDGTTDVAAGDALKAQNAGTSFIKATVGTDRFHAIALKAQTTNSAVLIPVLLYSSGRR